MPLITEVTHHMALLPVLWLGVLAYYGQRRGVLWWTVALVLGVSWLADTAAHWVNPWLVSALYPTVQALVLAAVLLPIPTLWYFGAVMISTTVLAVSWHGLGHPDVFARTAAWAGLLLIAWPHRALRAPILVTFGLGWLGWLAYSIAPGWGTWGVFQGIRAIGLGSFCWATAPHRVHA